MKWNALSLCFLVVAVGAVAGQAPNSAALPEERTDQASVDRHQEILKNSRKDAEVVFLGDHHVANWAGADLGLDAWKKHFEPLKAANLGVPGDRTQNVLWRITKGGELDGLQPKLIVLQVGSQNTWFQKGQSAEQIAEGVSAIVQELRRRKPDAKILVLGVLPKLATAIKVPELGDVARVRSTDLNTKVPSVNRLLLDLDDGKSVKFLDTGRKLLDSRGGIAREVMGDFRNLTKKGYDLWAEALAEPVKAMLRGDLKSVGVEAPRTAYMMIWAMARVQKQGNGHTITIRFYPTGVEPATIELPVAEVRIRDVNGGLVPVATVAGSFSEFRPVILTGAPEALDPFWLLNTKKDTLIVHADARLIHSKYPMNAPPTDPKLLEALIENGCALTVRESVSGNWKYNVEAAADLKGKPASLHGLEVRNATDERVKAVVDRIGTQVRLSQVALKESPAGAFTGAALKALESPAFAEAYNVFVGAARATLKADDFRPLGRMPNLSHLWVSDMRDTGDAIVRHLNGRALVHFHLNACDATDEGLRRINGERLRDLWVNSPLLTPAAYDHVARFTQLQTLNLVLCPKLTGEGLAKLKALPKLERLEIRKAGLRTPDLKVIAEMGGLRELRISENDIGDVGLKHLDNLNLVHLDVRQTRMTPAAIRQYAEAHPKCRVEWDQGIIEPK